MGAIYCLSKSYHRGGTLWRPRRVGGTRIGGFVQGSFSHEGPNRLHVARRPTECAIGPILRALRRRELAIGRSIGLPSGRNGADAARRTRWVGMAHGHTTRTMTHHALGGAAEGGWDGAVHPLGGIDSGAGVAGDRWRRPGVMDKADDFSAGVMPTPHERANAAPVGAPGTGPVFDWDRAVARAREVLERIEQGRDLAQARRRLDLCTDRTLAALCPEGRSALVRAVAEVLCADTADGAAASWALAARCDLLLLWVQDALQAAQDFDRLEVEGVAAAVWDLCAEVARPTDERSVHRVVDELVDSARTLTLWSSPPPASGWPNEARMHAWRAAADRRAA